MTRQRLLILCLIITLLLLGLIAFRWINPNTAETDPSTGFRQWLWTVRSPDLIVQMILIFAGALAIAAILPLEDDND